jgi:serine/threonine protein kinase
MPGELHGEIEVVRRPWSGHANLEAYETRSHRFRACASRRAPREALALDVQLAAAIGAAHERGVSHRDLKPGNVMITPAGTAKVLPMSLAWKPRLGTYEILGQPGRPRVRTGPHLGSPSCGSDEVTPLTREYFPSRGIVIECGCGLGPRSGSEPKR